MCSRRMRRGPAVTTESHAPADGPRERVLFLPRVAWLVAMIAAGGTITWFSLTPSSQVPGPRVSDVLLHVTGYAVLACLAVCAQARPRPWWTVAAVTGWGVVLEVAQGIGGLRAFEAKDIAMDAVGAGVGAVLATAARRVR